MLKNRLLNLSNRAVLCILIAVALASSGLSLIINIVNNVDTSPAWLVSWLQNFSTEMFGAFLTFMLLELVVGGRQQREAESKAERLLKQRLIIQMSSQNNAIALQGLEELRAHGWLDDGSLQGVRLIGANLKGAYLVLANLKGAHLMSVNLQGAHLEASNLQDVYLMSVNLKGAHLGAANLKGADLVGADFDETTTLPDNSHWTPDTDMTRFTQPDNDAR